jgi:hypothetical protein
VNSKLLAATVVLGAALSWGSVACADTVEVAVGNTSNIVGTECSPGDNECITGTAKSSPFTISAFFGLGNSDAAPDLLISSVTADKGTGTGTLTVYITDTGLVSRTGNYNFISGLTAGVPLPSGWTLTEATYLDSGDAAFGMTTPLASNAFTSAGVPSISTLADISSSPYSVTEVYTFDVTNAASNIASGSITLQIPEPASMALLGSGLLALGFVGWRRRRKGGP